MRYIVRHDPATGEVLRPEELSGRPLHQFSKELFGGSASHMTGGAIGVILVFASGFAPESTKPAIWAAAFLALALSAYLTWKRQFDARNAEWAIFEARNLAHRRELETQRKALVEHNVATFDSLSKEHEAKLLAIEEERDWLRLEISALTASSIHVQFTHGQSVGIDGDDYEKTCYSIRKEDYMDEEKVYPWFWSKGQPPPDPALKSGQFLKVQVMNHGEFPLSNVVLTVLFDGRYVTQAERDANPTFQWSVSIPRLGINDAKGEIFYLSNYTKRDFMVSVDPEAAGKGRGRDVQIKVESAGSIRLLTAYDPDVNYYP